jgi:NADH-quinone oxidoreductase subunit C
MSDTATTLSPIDEALAALAPTFSGSMQPKTQDGIPIVRVPRDQIIPFLVAVRDDAKLRFRLLLDVTALDYYGQPRDRFDVVYHLYSFESRTRLRVKTSCSERDAVVPSAVPEFPTAGFLEREVYDMFGIRFDGNPDLRRILMPEDYEHYPLRKDFPLEGIEPEKNYRKHGGVMMPRAPGAEPINGARSDTP